MVERLECVNHIKNNSVTSQTNKINNQANSLINKKNNNKSLPQDLSSDELEEKLKESIDDMNKIVDTLDENLSFKLHDETERLMTQIIDLETREVIKAMPPEEMLDLAARIHKIVGILIDEKV